MDKSRASRFSPAKRQICKQSGLDCGDGLSEKSKKERMRRLDVLGSKMGSVGSDGEDELRPTTNISKRFKVPRKFWDDCNPVNHSSVPRKLRSAKKKRNLESISQPIPDSEKPKFPINGVELSRKNGVKKSKMNMKQGKSNGSPVQASVVPITKDEEEVVETLYALADMFPNNEIVEKTTVDDELSQAKSVALPNEERTMHAIEVAKHKDDLETSRPSTATEGTNPSLCSEGSPKEMVEIKSLNEPSEPCLVNCKKLHIGLDSSVPQANLRKMSLSSRGEATEEKLLCSSIGFDVQSEMSLWSGLRQPKHDEAPASERKTEVAMKPAAAFSSQYELQHSFKERKISESQVAGTQEPSLQLTDAKLPPWLGNAASAIQPRSLEVDITTKMDSRVLGGRQNSWKRCTAHVYISRLIQGLKSSEGEDRLPLHPTLLTNNEGSKQGVLIVANSLKRVRNSNPFGSASEKNSNEVRNAIRLHKRLLQDQQQASGSSGMCSLRKQSVDFLSLSAGSGGMEANNSDSRATNSLETPTQLHVSYLQPLGHTSMPFSLPQNCYSSTFSDHIPEITARQLQVQQLPPYLGTPLYGTPHLGITASPKQHQQMIWAAHYKPGGVAPQHIPISQSGRQDSPSLISYAQTLSPPSRSSLEVLGPKYASISLQQHQNLMSMTPPLPSSRLKRQHNNVPFGYEGNGCGFHPDSSLSLQLLCNEHL